MCRCRLIVNLSTEDTCKKKTTGRISNNCYINSCDVCGKNVCDDCEPWSPWKEMCNYHNEFCCDSCAKECKTCGSIYCPCCEEIDSCKHPCSEFCEDIDLEKS